MNPIFSAQWIKPGSDYGDTCPVFRRSFRVEKKLKRALLHITALGVYEAMLNGRRLGDFIMAPGWTAYHKRLQYQTYDITSQLGKDNVLSVTIGPGWCVGRLVWSSHNWSDTSALIAAMVLEYTDNDRQFILTDETWKAAPGPVLFSEIYDGEIYDARIEPSDWQNVVLHEWGTDMLIPQEGEAVREIKTVNPVALITTPKGETVVDFGQNLTGYVRFRIDGGPGDVAEFSHAEVLDREGNFYTENLRSAKQKVIYTCAGGEAVYNPHLCFQGFRYIRLDRWPGIPEMNNFRAIAVHSDLKRTGFFECSDELVNKLYRNIIWGQRSNFLDVPTDCPQRDERLGWTGDAQVFARAAAYNFDVNKFFTKWLRDLKAEQFDDGGIPHVIPNALGEHGNSAAWGDAAVIVPWQLYLTYANRGILEEQFGSMQKWVDYIRAQGDCESLWNTGEHFGDWLGMDASPGSSKGATDEYLIATAFFAYSTSLLIKAGRVLGKDMSEYEGLYLRIVDSFQKIFIKDGRLLCRTQTAHALALYFDLVSDKSNIADDLAELVRSNGNRLSTGFVGTPYLLHALSENGYPELAYSLLLQQEHPSWLYSVNQGATTIWEHWDGIRPDGSMWSNDMNSFNHYAYGAVADWMYGAMAGIRIDEEAPGFRHIIFKPVTDPRLSHVHALIETDRGPVSSAWERKHKQVFFVFDVPEGSCASAYLGGEVIRLGPGRHEFQVDE